MGPALYQDDKIANRDNTVSSRIAFFSEKRVYSSFAIIASCSIIAPVFLTGLFFYARVIAVPNTVGYWPRQDCFLLKIVCSTVTFTVLQPLPNFWFPRKCQVDFLILMGLFLIMISFFMLPV